MFIVKKKKYLSFSLAQILLYMKTYINFPPGKTSANVSSVNRFVTRDFTPERHQVVSLATLFFLSLTRTHSLFVLPFQPILTKKNKNKIKIIKINTQPEGENLLRHYTIVTTSLNPPVWQTSESFRTSFIKAFPVHFRF